MAIERNRGASDGNRAPRDHLPLASSAIRTFVASIKP
jgi:hypothetical protein